MLIPSTEDPLSRSLIRIAQSSDLRQDLDHVLGDYCHRSRNRLNSLKLSIHLARRQASKDLTSRWDAVEQVYQELETQIDRLQTICRPMNLSPVLLSLGLLFNDRRESWSKLLGVHDRELVYFPPQDQDLACFDVVKLGAALDSLIVWRAQVAEPSSPIALKWWVAEGKAHILWSEKLAKFNVDQLVNTKGTSVWTLPLLIRVVAEHSGLLELSQTSDWQVLISWPTASPTSEIRRILS